MFHLRSTWPSGLDVTKNFLGEDICTEITLMEIFLETETENELGVCYSWAPYYYTYLAALVHNTCQLEIIFSPYSYCHSNQYCRLLRIDGATRPLIQYFSKIHCKCSNSNNKKRLWPICRPKLANLWWQQNSRGPRGS